MRLGIEEEAWALLGEELDRLSRDFNQLLKCNT